jgi:hypothetical protein
VLVSVKPHQYFVAHPTNRLFARLPFCAPQIVPDPSSVAPYLLSGIDIIGGLVMDRHPFDFHLVPMFCFGSVTHGSEVVSGVYDERPLGETAF